MKQTTRIISYFNGHQSDNDMFVRMWLTNYIHTSFAYEGTQPAFPENHVSSYNVMNGEIFIILNDKRVFIISIKSFKKFLRYHRDLIYDISIINNYANCNLIKITNEQD